MREGTAKNIKFESIEDLFGLPREFDENTISMVPLKNLFPYSNHPYRVLDDEKMMELAESIKENGVLEPAIVRLRALGGYEIISGHRRKRACELAGLDTMPVFVRSMSDDDAAVMMVDSNNHREELLFSEKAWAYRIKYEAMKHAGRKSDKNTADTVGEETGESGRQVQRYIRLTYLNKALLKMVDEGKIKFIPAERISHLNAEEQEILVEKIYLTGLYPSTDSAEKIKMMSMNGQLTPEITEDALRGKKKELKTFTLSAKAIKEYFPADYSKEDIERTLIELLKKWNRGQ